MNVGHLNLGSCRLLNLLYCQFFVVGAMLLVWATKKWCHDFPRQVLIPPMYMCTFMLCQNLHMLICGWWVSDCGCSCITWSCCIHAHLTPFHFSDVPLSYSCFYSLMPSCMCYIFNVTIQKYILSIYMLYGCILNIHTYIHFISGKCWQFYLLVYVLCFWTIWFWWSIEDTTMCKCSKKKKQQ